MIFERFFIKTYKCTISSFLLNQAKWACQLKKRVQRGPIFFGKYTLNYICNSLTGKLPTLTVCFLSYHNGGALAWAWKKEMISAHIIAGKTICFRAAHDNQNDLLQINVRLRQYMKRWQCMLCSTPTPLCPVHMPMKWEHWGYIHWWEREREREREMTEIVRQRDSEK